MSGGNDAIPAANPFATRCVRPGAVGYIFPPGHSARQLVDRLGEFGGWGQILGPHGSGKSCLLVSLMPILERAGRRPVAIELHDGQRRLPIDLRRVPGLDSGSLVIVDGYEQLAIWGRMRLKRLCRRRGMGLLVTAHAPVGLPTIYETSTTAELAGRIVDRLLCGDWSRIRREEVARRYAACQGNLREVLFDLYDLYERRRGDESHEPCTSDPPRPPAPPG